MIIIIAFTVIFLVAGVSVAPLPKVAATLSLQQIETRKIVSTIFLVLALIGGIYLAIEIASQINS